MSGKIIAAAAAAILLASTGLASAAGAAGPSAVVGGFTAAPYSPSPDYSQRGDLYNYAPGYASSGNAPHYYGHATRRSANGGHW